MSALRKWQQEAMRAFDRRDGSSFLLEATPGAGKTRFAIAACISEMQERSLRLFVVVPTEALKCQWCDAFHEQGLNLEPFWENASGAFPRDMVGVIITYQQLQSAPDLIRRHASSCTSMAVFDEIHHCNENGSWGDALRVAFDHEHCVCRLGLSGTPFRSDNNQIPFVKYIDGQGQPDFQYGYGAAMSDGVCRHVIFERQGGTAEWVTPMGDIRIKSFDDPVKRDELNQRLRAIIDPEGEWMRQTIISAHEVLQSLRVDDPDAGGLIVCKDQWSAKRVARKVSQTIGVEPVLVMSDEKESSARIKQFAKSRAPWIVAVRMVSEGVDIKRLRVGIYATVQTTAMFFRQVVGRFVRTEEGHEGNTAHLFIPDDERLRVFADEIRKQVLHDLLEDDSEKTSRERADAEADGLFFQVLGSTAEYKGAIYNEENYTPEELEQAKRILEIHGESMPPVKLAAILRTFGKRSAPPHVVEQEPPLSDKKKKVRNKVFTLAKVIAARFCVDHKEVNWKINKSAGITNRGSDTSLDALIRCQRVAERWIKDGELHVS